MSGNRNKILHKLMVVESEYHKAPKFYYRASQTQCLTTSIFWGSTTIPSFETTCIKNATNNSHFENLAYNSFFPRTPRTVRRWLACSSSLLKQTMISSIKNNKKVPRNDLNTPFIKLMNDACALVNPKDIVDN